MRSYLILFIFSFALVSCSKEATEVSIRIENVSKYDFGNVIVNSNGNEHNFADINSLGVTDYKTFPSAYKIANLMMLIKGELVTIQVIDHVGETPLEPGKYTYKINAVKDVSGIIKPSLECIGD